MKKKKAFTLAEVLITVGIIGIVAAMMLPNIVKKYQYQVYVTKLAEDYSILSNAIKMAENEYGPLSTWECPDVYTYKEFFDTHLKPHLKLTEHPCTNNNNGACYFETKDINGSTTRINAVGTTGVEAWNHIKVYLANGSMIGMRFRSIDDSFHVFIDVNGEQGPNRQGIDTFMMILPFKNAHNSWSEYIGRFAFISGLSTEREENLKIKCSKNYNWPGLGCGALIQRNGFKIPKNENWPAGYEYPY